MLQAQVNYWNYVETARHNVETEAIGWANYEESKRHNLETESIGWSTLEETRRHNLVSEQQGWQQVQASTIQATAAMKQANVAEFNAVEMQRSHKANEAISWANVAVMRAQAAAAAMQAQASMKQATVAERREIREQTESNARIAKLHAERDYTNMRVENYERELTYEWLGLKNQFYNTQINAAKAGVEIQTQTWNTIERMAPDAPTTLIPRIPYEPETEPWLLYGVD